MIVRRSALKGDEIILEIGSGLFALTIPLSLSARKVIAIEKDKDLIEIVREVYGVDSPDSQFPNVTIIEAGILDVDISEIAESEKSPLTVFGNLPYNISSQILVKLIENKNHISRAILMFQKELAERITEGPGSKGYGRLSVMLGYCSDIKVLADINANQFYPKPKVDSVVIEIVFKNKPEYQVNDENFFFKVIKAAFGQRRKTLRNALSGSELMLSPADAEIALAKSSIDPKRRAETLEISEFIKLTDSLSATL